MRKVLITGLTGFTGVHLETELCEAGYAVAGLTLPSEGKSGELDDVNLLDGAKVQASLEYHQPDFIIHLAGISFTAHPVPEEFYSVNVLGTENLLRAAHKVVPNVKKIVLASSGAVYGNRPEQILTEALCPKPVNHYTFSKLAMEHMAACWFDKLPITIVRPFNYVGRGQADKFLIPKIVSHFARREAQIELGNLDVWRDFSDVRDVARYYRLLLTVPSEGATLNLCSGTLTSLRDILEKTSDLSNHKLEVSVNPAFVRKDEIVRLQGSTDNLYAMIGEQKRYSIGDTLSWMLE